MVAEKGPKALDGLSVIHLKGVGDVIVFYPEYETDQLINYPVKYEFMERITINSAALHKPGAKNSL